MPVDPATAAQRYAAAAGTAQTRYTEGVQASTKDVGQLAAAQAPKMLQGVQNAINTGYWQRRVVEGGAKWKANTIAKASNYANGIQQGQTAYQQGYSAFWQAMAGPYQQLQNMPKTTLADSIARATYWIQAAASYQKP
jgi:hypothetical protein